MRYQKKLQYSWTRTLAYCVGLIASDGCLQKDGRHIDMTSIDYEQLENFSRAINKELKISEKSNTSKTIAYRVQFSDVSLYDFLVDAGLTPNKSKTISHINIPDQYYCDFLRGVFDGDGSVYAYYDKRWRSSWQYYLSFTSASRTFLEFLAQKNKSLVGTNGESIRKSVRSYSLVYGKADAKKIYHCFYNSTPAGTYLLRKRSKFEGFLLTDKNVKIQ